MDAESPDEYVALVLRLEQSRDGTWHIAVDGTGQPVQISLMPATLVVRLWRNKTSKLLRGQIQLHGSSHSAPFQSNAQLEALLHAWLLNDSGTTNVQ